MRDRIEAKIFELIISRSRFINSPGGKALLQEYFRTLVAQHQLDRTFASRHLAQVQEWIVQLPDDEESRRAIYDLLIQFYDDSSLRMSKTDFLEFIRKSQDRRLSTASFGVLKPSNKTKINEMKTLLALINKAQRGLNHTGGEDTKRGGNPRSWVRSCWNCGLKANDLCRATAWQKCKHKSYQPPKRRFASQKVPRKACDKDEFLP